jgi:hypothetical protein
MLDTTALIPFAEVPDLLPKHRGKRVHTASVFRWVQRGIKGVRLHAVQAGGRRCTTRAWLSEFFVALSERSGLETAPPPRSPAACDREHRRADKALEKAGW